MSEPVPTADILAVHDLVARYCWYVDENRGEDWAALYTEDGIFEGSRPEPVCGRAALAEVPGGIHALYNGKMRHHYGNLYVDSGTDANSLTARFYNQVSVWENGGGALHVLSVNTASLVRADTGAPWRIQRNSVVVMR
ncbi:nuclear transport factor 2 family protein [Yinghuangia sp. YIM S10712]|uniref:nuclear transport factor 2 family protein n=1 Tax=Yinghuangia sp. YIM S10712 TaxID=3436930 RepID=UPI003F52B471